MAGPFNSLQLLLGVACLDLLSARLRKAGVAMWCHRLMPNHVHLILCPSTPEGLGLARRRKPTGATHGVINAKLRVTGHLFQSRHGSVVMDEEHLMAAARCVAPGPARARLAERAATTTFLTASPPPSPVATPDGENRARKKRD